MMSQETREIAPPPPEARRRTPLWGSPRSSSSTARLAALVLFLGLATVSVVVLRGHSRRQVAHFADRATATVAVVRRTLVDRQNVPGALGFAGERAVTSGLSGTVTRLPAEGAKITRGEALYRVDERAVRLFYGTTPLWRPIGPGTRGADVRQLQQNLSALGDHVPENGVYDRALGEALKRWQRSVGLRPSGVLSMAQVTFLPGPRRIAAESAAVGARVSIGTPLFSTSSVKQIVTMNLDASQQTLVRDGDKVQVSLPSGRLVRGSIATVGKAATKTAGGATIEVTIALPAGVKTGGLDRAPVEVGIAREERRDALAVPVTALLALAGGGFAVDVVTPAGRHLVRVEPGIYADGLVELRHSSLRPRTRVSVPDDSARAARSA
jgi:peptidoglycan hydrolase-like protein with peptidoglycan-binding domain